MLNPLTNRATDPRVVAPQDGAADRQLVREVRNLTATVADLSEAVGELAAANAPTTSPDFHQRRLAIIDRLRAGDVGRALDQVTTLLDEQWKAPENTYLLGVVELCRGRFDAARAAIDRALAIRSWIDEVPLTVDVVEDGIRAAADAMPDWAWPRYRIELDEFTTFGLTLRSVVTERFERPDVDFVQVGAHDGIHDDPIHAWLSRFGWRGIRLEPIPEVFESLVSNCRELPNVTPVNAALSDTDGTRDLYVDESRYAISSFTPDRNLLKWRPDVTTLTVETRTFDSLVEEFGIESIDLLQIDTEGFDFEVLKLLDMQRCRPRVINMEFFALPIEERVELFGFLRDHGFAWRSTGKDLLCVDIEEFADQFGLLRDSSR